MRIGLNNSSLKTFNKGFVLWLVLSGQATSRIDIAAKTGLTKMTSTNIVGEFIHDNYLVEVADASENKRGRPIRKLALSPAAPKIVGIYLGKKNARVSLFDLSGTPARSARVSLTEEDDSVNVNKILEPIDQIIRTSLNEKILGFSIATVHEIGCSASSTSLNDRLENALNERYGLPVKTGAAGDAAAFLEHLTGKAKNHDNFALLNISDDIDGSLYNGGAPIKDNKGNGVRIGHISIDYNGLSCSCGNRGCLQSYASASAMEKKLRDITKLKADFQGFCEMQSKKNDSRIDWALKDMMDKIGFALSTLQNISRSDLIVIGGKGAYIPDRYLSKLEKALSAGNGKVKVEKSAFGEEMLERGAPAPLLQELLSGNVF